MTFIFQMIGAFVVIYLVVLGIWAYNRRNPVVPRDMWDDEDDPDSHVRGDK